MCTVKTGVRPSSHRSCSDSRPSGTVHLHRVIFERWRRPWPPTVNPGTFSNARAGWVADSTRSWFSKSNRNGRFLYRSSRPDSLGRRVGAGGRFPPALQSATTTGERPGLTDRDRSGRASQKQNGRRGDRRAGLFRAWRHSRLLNAGGRSNVPAGGAASSVSTRTRITIVGAIAVLTPRGEQATPCRASPACRNHLLRRRLRRGRHRSVGLRETPGAGSTPRTNACLGVIAIARGTNSRHARQPRSTTGRSPSQTSRTPAPTRSPPCGCPLSPARTARLAGRRQLRLGVRLTVTLARQQPPRSSRTC